MSTPLVGLLWLIAAGVCWVAARLWVPPWNAGSDRETRLRLTILGGAAALAAVTASSVLDRGWDVLWSESATVLARACVLMSVAILSWSRVADASRGRRRCPGCGHDLSGVPGRVCGECGRDAGDEGRLYLPRSSRAWTWAALGPLGAAAAVMTVSLARDPYWANRLPGVVLAAASPMAKPGSTLGVELLARVAPPGRPGTVEASVQSAVSRTMVAQSGDPERVLLHASVLTMLGRADAKARDRVLGLLTDPEPTVRARAAELLGQMGDASAPYCAGLVVMLADGDDAARRGAMRALVTLKRGAPGSPAPARLLALLGSPADEDVALASEMAGVFDPAPEVREALLGVRPVQVAPRAVAIVASRFYAADPRSAGVLARAVLDPGWSVDDIVAELTVGDDASRLATGELSDARRALYGNAAILDAVCSRVSPRGRRGYGFRESDPAKIWLVRHPELGVGTRLRLLGTMLRSGPMGKVALEQIVTMGAQAEPLRGSVKWMCEDPQLGELAAKALKAMGPDPSERPPLVP